MNDCTQRPLYGKYRRSGIRFRILKAVGVRRTVIRSNPFRMIYKPENYFPRNQGVPE